METSVKKRVGACATRGGETTITGVIARNNQPAVAVLRNERSYTRSQLNFGLENAPSGEVTKVNG